MEHKMLNEAWLIARATQNALLILEGLDMQRESGTILCKMGLKSIMQVKLHSLVTMPGPCV